MLNDGLHRRWYDQRVRAIGMLPAAEQSAERDALKRRTRRRLSPFGRVFSKWWSRRHPGRGTGGRAWVSNSTVDTYGVRGLATGCLLLICMMAWALLGTTPITVHVLSFAGGNAGGLVGGLLCESRELLLTLVGQLIGAAAGATGLVGIVRVARWL